MPSRDGCTPLLAAVEAGHFDCAMELLAIPGIDVDAPRDDGVTAVYAAAAAGYLEILDELVNAIGASFDPVRCTFWPCTVM